MSSDDKKDNITQEVGDATNVPEVPDLATILDGMVAEIHKHVVLAPHYARTVALWVLHAHGCDACEYSPRLNLRSPVPECGKTTLLEIIKGLCKARGAKIDSSITPAAYFRTTNKAYKERVLPPIMLLDEIDNFLGASLLDAYAILNSGHKRSGAWVSRCDQVKDGPHEANRYASWAPCVLAGIGEFSGTSKQVEALKSRCLVIHLKRKTATERVQYFDEEAEERCDVLGRQAHDWCRQNLAAIKATHPEMPMWLYNREADSWRMLFKFADAAGPRWAAWAREASKALNGRASDPSEGAMLLRDIRQAYAHRGTDRLKTADILEYLHGLIERPWGRKVMSDTSPEFQAKQLAAALRPFDIQPKVIRMGSGSERGYQRSQFEDAWARYLPPQDPEEEEAVAAE